MWSQTGVAGQRHDVVADDLTRAVGGGEDDAYPVVGGFQGLDVGAGVDGDAVVGAVGEGLGGVDEVLAAGQGVVGYGAPVGRGAAYRPFDAGAGQGGEVAGGCLGGLSGADEQDGSGPAVGVAGVREGAGDAVGDGAFAGGGDAAGAEGVGVGVGAGAVQDEVRRGRVLAVEGVQEEGEGCGGAGVGADLLVFEQAGAGEGGDAGAVPDAAFEGGQCGERVEESGREFGPGGAVVAGRAGRQVGAHAVGDVEVPRGEEPGVAPGPYVGGDGGRGFVDGERPSGVGAGEGGVEADGADGAGAEIATWRCMRNSSSVRVRWRSGRGGAGCRR
nr:hypothetical protein [Streptomyces sp. TRM70350]